MRRVVIKDSELHWSIVAKVDTAEAFAKEATFTRTMVLVTAGMIFVVCLLAILSRPDLRASDQAAGGGCAADQRR